MKRRTYLVTQIQIDEKDPKNDGKEFYALFHNLKEAQRFVKNNTTDIWETCFNYVCIEGVEDCVLPTLDEGITYRQFYKYNKEYGKFEECEPPLKYKNFVWFISL